MISTSTSQLYSTFITNIKSHQADINRTVEQISTGDRLLAPSDDPIAFSRSLELQNSIDKNNQYLDNMAALDSRLIEQELAITDIYNAVDEIKTKSLEAINGTFDVRDADSLSLQLTQLKETIISSANFRSYNGEYIFAGNNSNSPAFDSNGSYVGSNTQREVNISRDVRIQMGQTGNKLFHSNLIESIDTVIESLTSPDRSEIIQSNLSIIDESLEQLRSANTVVGLSLSQINSARELNLDMTLEYTRQRTELSDVDLTQALSKLQSQQTAYDATLKSYITASSLSLFDYI